MKSCIVLMNWNGAYGLASTKQLAVDLLLNMILTYNHRQTKPLTRV